MPFWLAQNPVKLRVMDTFIPPTEGQWLSEYRRQGRDGEFQAHLLRRHVRILGLILMRDAVAPWAGPVCNWLVRRLR